MLFEPDTILSFHSSTAADPDCGVSIVGGKGANLARMAQAGFPVPPGFLITTQANRRYIAENRLDEPILAALALVKPDDAATLETASAQIRALFTAERIPADLAAAIEGAYQHIGQPAVAVRSSATAEDLPDMSFAGQQDTYLNVLGPHSLLQSTADCWGSLWTARAIGYRARNHVDHHGAALAVVVQVMVQSQASGVLFTANPLTGLRTQTVIDATVGLGEALVSGLVEPDHYVVDVDRAQIVEKTLGAKVLSIRSLAEGGTVQVAENQDAVQAIPDEIILSLARLGKQVADLYAFPQDIEWAWADQTLYLLQSRPITSLYPTPEGMPVEPLNVLFSFAAVQGMLDPFTPLGRDSLAVIFSMGARLFGIHVTSETQTVLHTAGERLWVRITPLMRNTVGRKAIGVALDLVEPTVKQALNTIWEEPRLRPQREGLSLKARMHLARFFIPLAGNVLLNIAFPRARRRIIVERGERLLEMVKVNLQQAAGDRHERLASQAFRLQKLTEKHLPGTFLPFVSGISTAMASFNLLNQLAKGLPDESGIHKRDLVLEITRGLPHNPTTEMDLDLWAAAQSLRADPASWQEFQAYHASELAQRYQTGELSPHTTQIIRKFLARYGGRGLGEIDMGRIRWQEDPTHVFEALGGYLQIEDHDRAPDVVFARGAGSAVAAVGQLASGLRKTRHGWMKAHLARFAASRVRELMGIRESPKFFAVRLMGLLRQDLLKIGEEFVQNGELETAEDLFYLNNRELSRFASGNLPDYRGLVTRRRAVYQRELLRRQIPRLLLSDGRAFYEGMNTTQVDGTSLNGSPVSPGMVEGNVRVVLDPRSANLLPGEILVCPGTDPSWTPLFLTAGGLVMEVGGMMTHGAVVAREYGIPAIVGVNQATHCLKTGQRIRMDGSSGVISLVEEVV